MYTEVLLDTDRGRHGTPLPTTPDVRHVEEDDRADGEGSEPPDSEQIGLAVPFAVGASSQWARYLGGRFAPSNVDELADDLSWLLCPLMADAAGLAELFPHPVAPRPELTGVWAGLPQWSHCSSPVRNLTWTRLVELAAGALGERHRVVGHSGTLREAMVESMDRRNHWPAVMQQDLLDRLDSLFRRRATLPRRQPIIRTDYACRTPYWTQPNSSRRMKQVSRWCMTTAGLQSSSRAAPYSSRLLTPCRSRRMYTLRNSCSSLTRADHTPLLPRPAVVA